MTAKARKSPRPKLAPPQRSVVLVGLMGVGKSTIGRRLARRLSLEFVDADSEIEKAAGCSINDIFEFHGEAAFREGERRVIKRLLAGPPRIVAAGGGAFMDPETREHIRAHALSVWLRADIETLIVRVSRNTHRPLLRNGDVRETLTRLSREREPVYRTADVVVDSGDSAIDKVVDATVEALRPMIEGAGAQGNETAASP